MKRAKVSPKRSAATLARRLRAELRHLADLDAPIEARDPRAQGHRELVRHLHTWLEVQGYGHRR